MFLKEKTYGAIKGRDVDGGKKQREYVSKEDASSPTVAKEALLLSCIVDAEEESDVAVIDIPNAFIQTQVEDEKYTKFIKICRVLVDILVEISLDVYSSHVTTDKKGLKQLLVQCHNALYDTIVASLLQYHKFTKILIDVGFKINLCDPCISNKMIDGQHMTICYHVDNFKLIHRRRKVNDRMIKWLRQEYKIIFKDGSGKMKVIRGKVHKYLGMTLDDAIFGQVQITMINFIDEVLIAFDKVEPKGDGTKTSAAP